MSKAARTAKPKSSRAEQRASTELQLRTALQSLVDQSKEITVSAVAAEAGYSHSLVFNSYPGLAEEIRTAAGKSLRAQLEKAKQELGVALERNAQLRDENKALDQDVKDLASENESLRRELDVQRAMATGKVTKLR